ncbi:hemocytin-like [Drosophila takahashii]|uniref:hemocytin-like n=1 Tax=Drosophila takahashii TaxID=29030 RepID=UPI001CF80656|nr:hemocytin-like [Drosophila takahashii]
MEGLCGNCNGLSLDDLQVNPAKPKPAEPRPFDLVDFVTSWQVDEPRLGIDTRSCRNQQVCKPLPRERNVCYQLIVQSGIFGRCPLLVDPLAFIVACQKDSCTASDDKEVVCATLTAYAAACNQVGVCTDWRPFTQCPANCLPGMAYKPCDCDVSCETGIDRVDRSNLEVIFKGRCLHTARHEGCFCPPDKVLHHGRCVSPNECVTCGDGRHVGDVWQPDKCSRCECLASGQVSCEKEQCGRDTDHICQKGYKLMILQRDFECCPTRICVPDTGKPGQICETPKLPDCGPHQVRIVDEDVHGCSIYRCECKPRDQCEPTPPLTLKPGEKLEEIVDGCCPSYRVICHQETCPKPPATCDEQHYELISEKQPGDCCAVYRCVPPKDRCLHRHIDQVQVHRPGDKWQLPDDPCVAYECVLTDQVVVTVTTVLTCEKKCPLGFTYEHTNSAKCCGSCVPTGCVHNGRVYKPDETWTSADKCTIYSCIPRQGQLIIHELHETCPDVSLCPAEHLQDDGGCCRRCRIPPPPVNKVDCQAVTVAPRLTLNLIRFQSQEHGMCHNDQPIQGLTQCEGACNSAFKYNPLLNKYEDRCSCCAATGLSKLLVKVTCGDGSQLDHSLEVPTGCSCEPCSKHHPGKTPAGGDQAETHGKPKDPKILEEGDDEEFDLQDLLNQSGGVISR